MKLAGCWPRALVLGTIIGAGVIAFALFYGAARPWLAPVPADICLRGNGRVLMLKGPFSRQGEHGFLVMELGSGDAGSDHADNPTRSTAVLCEDGHAIGSPHSLHDDIRSKGGGLYSHWSGSLYFSTSDNSDPNTNGRTYKLIMR
jgi:hypothetical protein